MTHFSALRRPARLGLTAAILLLPTLPLLAQTTPVATAAFAEPAVSPDRQELAFVSGGDIWTVPVAGGEARLLVAHAATESRPLYSPDGKQLAFSSTRTGNGDVYVLTLATGEVRRLTFDDAPEQLDAWAPDGQWLYFSSTSHDIASMNDIYRVALAGGTPLPLSADHYANEYFAAPAPDGRTVAFTARGIVSSQWWRHGHSHLDESEIWVQRAQNGAPTYTALTNGGAKDLWPMWAADGQHLFFVSDRNGQENIWTMAADGSGARAVTSFTEGRVLWPSMSADGKLLAFERDFRLWTLDPANGQVREVKIQRRGAPAGSPVERTRYTDRLQELALAPDGKKVAFVVHGEVFAASATEGGEATRLTLTPAAESDIMWAPNSRWLIYRSERNGAAHIYRYDFSSGQETQLTSGSAPDAAPRLSPDGQQLAFEHDARELRILDLATKKERVVATASFDKPPLHAERSFVWSPDGQWLAFMPDRGRRFTNVSVVPTTGGKAQPISFVANANSTAVSWSPDGKYILFDTGQRTEDAQIARVDLQPRTPRFREDQFRDLFREQQSPTPATPDKNTSPTLKPTPTISTAAPDSLSAPTPPVNAKKAPVQISFEDIRRRLSLLPIGLNVGSHAISPDGKHLVVTGYAANQSNLYLFSLDELSKEPAVARQLTSTAGQKREVQFSPDSKKIFYLDQGKIQTVLVAVGSKPQALAVSAEMDVDFEQEKMAVFEQAWSYLNAHFADATFNGVNWQAQHDRYAPLVAGARTPDESRRIINLMIGELNASHSGLNAGPAASGTIVPSTGRLGLTFDAAEYEQHGRLRVASVLPLSAGALAGIRPGEVLLAVDGTPLSPTTNLDDLLQYRVGRRVTLRLGGSAAPTAAAPATRKSRRTKTTATPAAGATREVTVLPLSRDTEKGLAYRQWVEERRAYVNKISGGRLGYVHMYDMSAGSLSQLYLDLDAENLGREGVVVDVRNNNGGFVNVYAIDVLARRSYLTFTRRDQAAPMPARTSLGQRALEQPTVLVTNQHSLSDAEDFTEGYRALKLGKVVGEPTAGWIIFTSNVSLLDGSSLRLPSTTIRAASDGQIMEMNPRPVDVAVKRPIGESYSEHDVQLDAAVKELLGQLGSKAGSTGGQ